MGLKGGGGEGLMLNERERYRTSDSPTGEMGIHLREGCPRDPSLTTSLLFRPLPPLHFPLLSDIML